MTPVRLTLTIAYDVDGGPDYMKTYRALRKDIIARIIEAPGVHHITTGEPHIVWEAGKTFYPRIVK